MKNIYYLITLSLVLAFFACDPEGGNNNSTTTTSAETADKTKSDQAADSPPTEQATYDFALIPGLTIYEEETLVPSTDIYLTSPKFPEAILLVNDYNFSPYEKANWASYDIPANAAFAFQSWFAGGGAQYYGLLKGDQLELFRRYLEEGSPEEEEPVELPVEKIKTIDLNNTGQAAGYFICYQADKQPNLQLAIHFNDEGHATALRYKGQSDYIPLQFTGEKISNEGIIPNITQDYLEIFEGKENGKLQLTHSGNWDYATYTRGKDGRTFDFTIDHDGSIVDDTYRTTPCFE